MQYFCTLCHLMPSSHNISIYWFAENALKSTVVNPFMQEYVAFSRRNLRYTLNSLPVIPVPTFSQGKLILMQLKICSHYREPIFKKIRFNFLAFPTCRSPCGCPGVSRCAQVLANWNLIVKSKHNFKKFEFWIFGRRRWF